MVASIGGLCLLISFMTDSNLFAQDSQLSVGPADTTSPRATLRSFIEACNQFHEQSFSERYFDRRRVHQSGPVNRALDCLDTSMLPNAAREELASDAAVYLKEVLDRIEVPDFEDVPDAAEMEADGTPFLWQIPGTRIAIARIEEGPRRYEYLFTASTVRRAPDIYHEIEPLPYRESGPDTSPGLRQWYTSAPGHPAVAAIVDMLPEFVRDRVYGLAIWHWGGLAVCCLIAIGMAAGLYRLYWILSRRWRGKNLAKYCATIILPVIVLAIPSVLRRVAEFDFAIRGEGLVVLIYITKIATLAASVVVVFGLASRIAETIITSPKINPSGLNAQFIRIITQLFGIFASVFVLLEGAQLLGMPVTTLLASAGVGGLAVALASQSAIKSIFSTVMLMADRPFRVGDRIIIREYDGLVEDIGLRSTRLRLLTGNQVTVPNDVLASNDIENVSRRPHIRRVVDLGIPLDHPLERVEKALEVIRAVLQDHEGMDPDHPPRVHFDELIDDSYNIKIYFWYGPPDFWKFRDFSERVNLEICMALEAEGIDISLPARVAPTSLDGTESKLNVQVTRDSS